MLITKDMGIMEIVQKYPATVEVLQRFGMGCIGCAAAHFENIEQGATAHGIDGGAEQGSRGLRRSVTESRRPQGVPSPWGRNRRRSRRSRLRRLTRRAYLSPCTDP